MGKLMPVKTIKISHGELMIALKEMNKGFFYGMILGQRHSYTINFANMFFHVQSLINEIVADEPDPSAANALQEGLGGQFGEMRTMMQYLFQSFNFRGDAVPYLDLIQGVGIEEISHVELISKTIATLLDGSPQYNGKKFDVPGKGGVACRECSITSR